MESQCRFALIHARERSRHFLPPQQVNILPEGYATR